MASRNNKAAAIGFALALLPGAASARSQDMPMDEAVAGQIGNSGKPAMVSHGGLSGTR